MFHGIQCKSVVLSIHWFVLFFTNDFQTEGLPSSSINDISARNGRFFPLFKTIKFPNNICQTGSVNSTIPEYGVCYLETECAEKGGIKTNTCQSNLGVCCAVVKRGYGGMSDSRLVYWRNSNYPSPNTEAVQVSATLNIPYENICQIRFDLDKLQLPQPNTVSIALNREQNKCENGNLRFDGYFGELGPKNLDKFIICGDNSGQHFYVHRSEGVSQIQFRLSLSAGNSGLWSIRTTMIDCDNPKANEYPQGILQAPIAPGGCFQYFQNTNSTLPSAKKIASFNSLTKLISGLQYTSCFDVPPNKEGLKFTKKQLSLGKPPAPLPIIPECNKKDEAVLSFSNDHLEVCPNNDYFTNTGLNDYTSKTTGPITLKVDFSDNAPSASDIGTATGFEFDFVFS